MENIKLRRFTAYCLDLLLITLIATGLFEIKHLHPYADKYEKAYNNYTEYVSSFASTSDNDKTGKIIMYVSNEKSKEELSDIKEEIMDFKEVDNIKKVTIDDVKDDEEYKEVYEYLKENDSLDALIITVDDITKVKDIKNYAKESEDIEDYKVIEKEKNKSLSEMSTKEMEEYLDKTGTLLRDVDFYGMSYNICWLVVTILYFTLFPYFNNGMTIGKRVVKLQMVRSDDENKKVSLWQYFVKAALCPIYGTAALSNSLSFLVMIITPLTLNGATFAYTTTILNLIICVLCYVDLFMIAFKKNGFGYSDKLAKVKVINYVRA